MNFKYRIVTNAHLMSRGKIYKVKDLSQKKKRRSNLCSRCVNIVHKKYKLASMDHFECRFVWSGFFFVSYCENWLCLQVTFA